MLLKRTVNLAKVLPSQYDHVIVDSAPILAATDASIIGQLASATLMALKTGTQRTREIELSFKRLKQANINLRALLSSDVKSSNRRFGAGKHSD